MAELIHEQCKEKLDSKDKEIKKLRDLMAQKDIQIYELEAAVKLLNDNCI